MILIVTNQQDLTSDLVILSLQERGIGYARFNTEDFPTRTELSWSLTEGEAAGALTLPNRVVHLDDVSAVWYRRPAAPQPADQLQPAAAVFARSESEAALQNLWSLLDCYWVSRPEAINRASKKLDQLQRASRLGVAVPATLVTMNPSLARMFCQAHPEVIAKPLGRGYIDAPDSSSALIYTNRLRPSDLDALEQVRWAPTLLQEEIRNQVDLRVTVVGQRIFSTEIHVPTRTSGQVDWRREDIEHLPHVPHRLPAVLEQQVLVLVRSYGLQFAALDFIITPDGRYVFLELNPNGQWAWIEQLIGTAISDALVALLSGQAAVL